MNLKITPYGFFVFLAVVVSVALIPEIKISTIIIILLSPFIQKFFCKNCSSHYSLASYLTILPLMIILFTPDCNYTKNILTAIFNCFS